MTLFCFSVGHFYAVDQFKMLICLNWKSASTAFRWLVFNNTFPKPLPAQPLPNFERMVENAKLYRHMYVFGDLPISKMKEKLKTYYKVMTVRHPLDRLVSTYRDKLINHR